MRNEKEEYSRRLDALLYSFSCPLDLDIEAFIHNRAIEFEKLSKSCTYLVCEEEALIKKKELFIYGYFSMSLKTLRIPEGISNRKRKELDGFSAKIHGEPVKEIPCYLIGQLAKNAAVTKGQMPGSELVEYARSVAAAAKRAVGGRYMMIECRDREKLLQFYEKNHFKEIARIPYGETPMIQMLSRIQ